MDYFLFNLDRCFLDDVVYGVVNEYGWNNGKKFIRFINFINLYFFFSFNVFYNILNFYNKLLLIFL